MCPREWGEHSPKVVSFARDSRICIVGQLMIPKSRAVSPFSLSLINIILVLFLMNLVAFIGIALNAMVEIAKQDQTYTIILTDQVSEQKGAAMAQEIAQMPFAESARYVSKTEAHQQFRAETGDEFETALGDANDFLPATIVVRLRQEYTNVDSVTAVSLVLKRRDDVSEIYYPLLNIATVNERAGVMRIAGIGIGVIMLLLSFLLIRNTVRIALFSRRMVIRAMQLVGATDAFIRKPFLKMGVVQGLVGALVADGLVIGLVFLTDYIAANTVGDLHITDLLLNWQVQVYFLAMLIFGATIGYASSYSATSRFLNKSLDQLA
jgi:cell division transport system permease protein